LGLACTIHDSRERNPASASRQRHGQLKMPCSEAAKNEEETSVRTSSLAKIAVVGVAGILVLSACSNSKKNNGSLPNSNNSGGNNSNKTYKIGFQGALSGDNQQLGI